MSAVSPARFPSEVIYDVYANVREKFKAPPIEGFDLESFRPVGRHEVPERFGRSILPPNGVPDPEPDVLERLLHANYVYRIRVSNMEPPDLSYLAHSLTTAASLAKAVDGVIRDVHTRLVLTYRDAREVLKSSAFDIADHVLVHAVQDPKAKGLWLHTHGLTKFGRADIEVRGIPEPYQPLGTLALQTIARYLSQGKALCAGETMQLGAGFLTFSESPSNTHEDFPNGLLRVCDFNSRTKRSGTGMVNWFTTVVG